MFKGISKYFFIFSFFITGCVYCPQLVDIPLIDKKNDLRLDGNVTFAFTGNGTVSYGLTKNIALQAYASGGIGHYYQGAAGYYRNLGKQAVMEIYGGYGAGYGTSVNDASPGHLYDHYRLYFTQFNIGLKEDLHVHIEEGLGLKFGYLSSRLTDKNYFYPHTGENADYEIGNFLFEPEIFTRFGGKKLKFNVKIGACGILRYGVLTPGPDGGYNEIPYGRFNVGIGLNYRF